jgi:hypothetical protein
MAGYLKLRAHPKVAWSASGWMFDWVANFLADNLGDPDAAAIIRERIEANLGDLDLEKDLAPKTKDALVLLASTLVPYSRQRLPSTMANREGALGLLEQLAALARGVLGSRAPG